MAMKHSPNGRSLDNSFTASGKGTLYAMKNDKVTGKPIQKTTLSLGFNNSISLDRSSDTTEKTHSNFDKVVTYASSESNVVYTLNTEMKSFELDVLAIYENSSIVSNAAATLTFDVTVEKTDITETKGFIYPIRGAIDTCTVKFGSENAVENVHYTLHNGAVVFNSLERQRAAGATTLLNPTSADVEVEITIKTLENKETQPESGEQSYYTLYAEIYVGDYLDQYYFHKCKVVNSSLPIKNDSDEDETYSPAWTILAAEYITDPAKSPYYEHIRTKIK